ncbi:hypothetical protein [Novosphingobium sp. ZW T3_23]|uniref:hypothetical protein n=1 Tax=Novosphingobium sp. ZW T3_23 TaxID=3378084 RepID=UPI0038520A7F
MDWLTWLRKLFLQPRHDERVATVAEAVEELRAEQASIRRRVDALEAFRRVSDGGRP